jgi:hypothetical protein
MQDGNNTMFPVVLESLADFRANALCENQHAARKSILFTEYHTLVVLITEDNTLQINAQQNIILAALALIFWLGAF